MVWIGCLAATLHIPTLFLMIVLVSATLTLVVGLVVERAQRDGMLLWAAGLAAHTLAYGLLALRGAAPDLISVVGANVLLSATFAFFGESLCQFQGRRPRRALLWTPLLVTLVSFAALMNTLPARLLAGPLIFGAQILGLLVLLARARARTAGRGQYIVFFALGALLPVLGALAATVLTDRSFTGSFMAPHRAQAAAYMIVMASTVMSTFGWVLMNKERADHHNRTLAMLDDLTALPNRRHALQALAQQVAMARRGGQALTVLMLDIDHFKAVNDRHGHLVGDEALRHVAQTLRARLRSQDLLGRIGGEEFLAVLPATAAEPGGLRLAEDVRAAVASRPLAVAGAPDMALTVSIGVAEIATGSSRTAQDLIRAADLAMYRAKAAGRNGVERAREQDYEYKAAAPVQRTRMPGTAPGQGSST